MNTRCYPPGPKSRLPFGFDNLINLTRDPLGLLRKTAKYGDGDVGFFRIGRIKVYVLNNPSLVKNVLVTNNKLFDKGKNVVWLKRFLGEGLVTSEGEFHLKQRRLIQPAFHKTRIETFASTITDYTLRNQARWQAGQTLNLEQEMAKITKSVITKLLFNSGIENEDPQLEEALKEIIQWSGRGLLPLGVSELLEKWPLPSTRRFQNAKNYLDKKIYQLIAEHRLKGEKQVDDSLLSMLLEANDPQDDGRQMTSQQLRDELVTLFMAGHGTTGLALMWTWYLIALHPQVEENLHEELDRVLKGRLPTVDDLRSLSYTEKIVTEALRMYPPAYVIIRNALADFQLAEYSVPAKSFIVPSPYVMHYNESFFPEPTKFNPDRWDGDFKNSLPKFAYFPFGGGPRVCIGEALAWMEIMLVIATIGQRWRLRLGQDQSIALKPLLTLRSKGGIYVTLEKRLGL